ncbi:glycine--tRNA ligase [Patescibacteria group bacterium]|nr:glycine--tRNA ligase [Patescibacteria group bacterium]
MDDLMQKLVSFTKRRGFIFPSSEIYGGFGSCYDFGPLGVEMKRNIKQLWWDEMTKIQKDIVGLDASILMSPKVWEASGHLTAGFADELVECKKCHHRFRKDLLEKDKCPDCKGELTDPKKFNLMMKTSVGPLEDENSTAYLRAETCQGIYVNFKNVVQSMRMRPPFGIAQIGKAFRNEITPKNFIFRTREFEQMEMQWFCDKKDASKFFDYWLEQRLNWYYGLGIDKKNLRTFEVPKEDLAHYAQRAVDIEYKFPFGWKEIEGIHNRGDWDLSNHSKHSNEDMNPSAGSGQDGEYPHVIETSVGADRSFFAFLTEAYQEIEGGRGEKSVKETETVFKIHPKIAPIKVAILPLVKNKEEIVKKAREVEDLLKKEFTVQYDESGAIGRRYRRQDEIGTPVCVTIDFETLENNEVTIRDRDTMKQEHIKIENLTEFLRNKFNV